MAKFVGAEEKKSGKRVLRKGNIYRNLYAGYETYILYLGRSGSYAEAVTAARVNGRWDISTGRRWSLNSLIRDAENFPEVGRVGMDDIAGLMLNTDVKEGAV